MRSGSPRRDMTAHNQLSLDLRATTRPGRQRTPMERLADLLRRRRGIDAHWRRNPSETTRRRLWIMPIVGLDVGDRLRTEPRSAATGMPAQGCWETVCAWHVNAAQHCPEDRWAYRDPGRLAELAAGRAHRSRVQAC